MVLWCEASSNSTWFLRWFRMVPELDIYRKSWFLQHFGHGSKHGSGWFRMVPVGHREIPNRNRQHNSLYFGHFGHWRPELSGGSVRSLRCSNLCSQAGPCRHAFSRAHGASCFRTKLHGERRAYTMGNGEGVCSPHGY